MGTNTANYSFQKPTDGADDDVWATDFTDQQNPATDPSPGLNGNWSKIDILLQSIQDRVDAADAALDGIPEAVANAEIKVGGFYMTTAADDPNIALGYGTWQLWKPGHTMVSAGDNGEGVWTPGIPRGSELSLLEEANLPLHNHDVDFGTVTSSENGDHNHSKVDGSSLVSVFSGGSGGSGGSQGGMTLASAGNHSHSVTIPATTSSVVGGGLAHNNLQPSKAVYVWERIA